MLFLKPDLGACPSFVHAKGSFVIIGKMNEIFDSGTGFYIGSHTRTLNAKDYVL